jgi:hypothetical protein
VGLCRSRREQLTSARNGRTVAGTLLRSCVVPKVSYLCRTVRPDLFHAAAKRADDLGGRKAGRRRLLAHALLPAGTGLTAQTAASSRSCSTWPRRCQHYPC